MGYVITDMLIEKNRPRTVLNAKGMVVHETATPNATAENEQKYFAGGAGGRQASAHAFIDYDSIVRTIPFNEQAWHAGATANHNYIGIELCHFDDEDKFNEVYKRAVWFFADTFVNYLHITTVTTDNLMSHAEVSAKWHETNHTDPVSYFKAHGKSVDMFRADVQKEINNMIAPPVVPYCGYLLSTKLVKQSDANVRAVQKALGINADGRFGNQTKAAVIAFQKAHGLTSDGIVGSATWACLFNG
jgi:N-acetylmuramoyl-L-alanine amidase